VTGTKEASFIKVFITGDSYIVNRGAQWQFWRRAEDAERLDPLRDSPARGASWNLLCLFDRSANGTSLRLVNLQSHALHNLASVACETRGSALLEGGALGAHALLNEIA